MKLICVFVFTYAICWFYHDAAHTDLSEVNILFNSSFLPQHRLPLKAAISYYNHKRDISLFRRDLPIFKANLRIWNFISLHLKFQIYHTNLKNFLLWLIKFPIWKEKNLLIWLPTCNTCMIITMVSILCYFFNLTI